ncbi:MAG: addiction module protein [Planctomycetes bacterium]|nr:addiction module protein [Planctomycetota bacterium]
MEAEIKIPDTVDLKALLKLSASERAKIVSLLWESLEEEGAAAILHEQQYTEAEQRIAELKSNPRLPDVRPSTPHCVMRASSPHV